MSDQKKDRKNVEILSFYGKFILVFNSSSTIFFRSYGLNSYHRNSRYSDDDTDEGTNDENAEKQPVRVSDFSALKNMFR